jgi:peptidoglycan hydrolase FlgJ
MKVSQSNPAIAVLESEAGLSESDRTKLRAVAQQFEAVFVNQMVGAMRKTVQPGGLVPQGQGEKIYQGMLDAQHADHLAESRQLGLSDLIYEHLLRSSGGR